MTLETAAYVAIIMVLAGALVTVIALRSAIRRQPRPQVDRHLINFSFRDAFVLEHPTGENPAHCPASAVIESLRLPDGRMQVQGLYRETASGTGYERVGES